MTIRNILCVVGTRPEAIKVAPVIAALREESQTFRVRVLVTAQHREMLDQILKVFSIVPDVDLDLMRPGQSLNALAGRVLIGVNEYLAENPVDIVLAQGDTTTVMAVSIACFHNRVSFGHIEAFYAARSHEYRETHKKWILHYDLVFHILYLFLSLYRLIYFDVISVLL